MNLRRVWIVGGIAAAMVVVPLLLLLWARHAGWLVPATIDTLGCVLLIPFGIAIGLGIAWDRLIGWWLWLARALGELLGSRQE